MIATSAVTVKARGGLVRLAISTMRPAQWSKNLFVLGPLLFAKKLADPAAGLHSLMACACFCLMSSLVYVLNDIIDIEADRKHPIKRNRPLASGQFPIQAAWALFGVLTLSAFAIAIRLGSSVAWLAVLYFATMVAYCLGLKRLLILDSIVIAMGFVFRVVAGAAAVSVEATHWLIACTFLLTLYLAFAKRRQELTTLSEAAASHRSVLGKYSGSYLDQVNNILLGTVIVCYALYTVAPETVERFGTDRLIYGSVFVLYGMLRYMALMQMGNGADPNILILRDKPLWLTVFLWSLYNCVVIYRKGVLAVGSYLVARWFYT